MHPCISNFLLTCPSPALLPARYEQGFFPLNLDIRAARLPVNAPFTKLATLLESWNVLPATPGSADGGAPGPAPAALAPPAAQEALPEAAPPAQSLPAPPPVEQAAQPEVQTAAQPVTFRPRTDATGAPPATDIPPADAIPLLNGITHQLNVAGSRAAGLATQLNPDPQDLLRLLQLGPMRPRLPPHPLFLYQAAGPTTWALCIDLSSKCYLGADRSVCCLCARDAGAQGDNV